MIGSVLIALIIPIVKYFDNADIYSYWYFLLVYPFTYITSSCIENICVSTKRTKTIIPYRIIHSAVVLTVVLISSFLKLDFKIYLIVYLSCEAAFATFIYFYSNKITGRLKISFDKSILKQILTFSIPLGLATAVGTLNSEIDKFMIGFMMSTENVAIYTNCAKELPFTILVSGFTAALLPRIASLLKANKKDEALKMWGRVVVIALSIISVFAFGLFCYAEDVVSILYSDKYLPGVNVFRVFCIILISRAVYWGLILNCSSKTKLIFISAIVSLIFNIGLNIPFYYLFGMIGCAIATLISTFLLSFFQLICTSVTTKTPISKILPWKKILIVLVINFVFYFVFFFIKKMIPLEKMVGSQIESIVYGIIWVGLYFLTIFLLKKKLFAPTESNCSNRSFTETVKNGLRRIGSKLPSLNNDKWLFNKIGFILCCIMVFLSFFGGSLLGFTISGITISVCRLFAIVCLIYMVLFNRKFFEKIGNKKRIHLELLLGFWIILGCAQIPFCIDFSSFIKHFLVLGMVLFLLLFIYTFVDTKKQLSILLAIANLSILIILSLSVYEIFTGRYFLKFDPAILKQFINKTSSNIFGLYEPLILANPNNVAFMCCIATPLLITEVVVSKSKIIKTLGVLTLVINSFVLICTDSRSGIFSMLVFIIFVFILSLSKKTVSVVFRFVIPPIVVASIILIILYLSKSTVASDTIRTHLYLNSLYILFSKNFLIGLGLGQAPNYLVQFANTGSVVEVHSFFLEALISSGLLFFPALLLLFIKWIKQSINHSKECFGHWKTISSIIAAFLISFIVSSFGPSSFFTNEWSWVAFIFLYLLYEFYFEAGPASVFSDDSFAVIEI